MRKLLGGMIIALLLFSVACSNNNKRIPWTQNDITSFAAYYGEYGQKYYPEAEFLAMSRYQAAIVDTRRIPGNAEEKKAMVKQLKDAGTYVVTYVSFGEDVKDYNPDMTMKSYYFDKDNDGKPDLNTAWGSIYVNVNDEAWKEEIFRRIQEDAVDTGADGIFMDTIETTAVYPEIKDGMIALIASVHKKFPDLKLVANQGLSYLDDLAPMIDGLMLESFTSTWTADGYAEYERQDFKGKAKDAKKVNEMRTSYPMPVFVLDYADPDNTEVIQRAYDRAWEYDFVPYVSTKLLDKLYAQTFSIQPQSVRGAKVGKEMDEFGGDKPDPRTDPGNLALASNDAQIEVDSIFPNYDKIALNDGYRYEEQLTWDEVAWASALSPASHWVEIKLAKASEVNQVDVYWATDHGQFMSSQEFRVEYNKDGEWVPTPMVKVEQNTSLSTVKLDAPVQTDAIRVFQGPMQGPKNYTSPGIMWISEIEVY